MDDDIFMNIVASAGFNGHSTLDDARMDEEAQRMIAADLEIGDTSVDVSIRNKWDTEENAARKKWKKKKQVSYTQHACIIPSGLESIHLARNKIAAGKWDATPVKVEPPTAENKMFYGMTLPPSPLYRYTFLYEAGKKGKHHYVVDHRTAPLMPESITAKHIAWLLKVVLNFNERDMPDLFGTWDYAPCIPMYWYAARTPPRDVFAMSGQTVNFAFDSDMRMYRAFLFVYNLLLEKQRSAMGEKMRAIMSDASKMQGMCEEDEKNQLLSNVFVTHPETIRFYGGTAYSELCMYYDAGWVMGLSLIELYNLHHTLRTDPASLVLMPLSERMINQRHIYSVALQPLAQTPLNVYCFAHVLKISNLLKNKAYVPQMIMAFTYGTLIDLTETGNHKHRYVPLSLLITETKRFVYQSVGDTVSTVTDDLCASSVVLLSEKGLLVVSHPEGMNPSLAASIVDSHVRNGRVDQVLSARVQLAESFKEDAILAMSVRRLLARFAKSGPPPIADNFCIDENMCSEQVASLLMVQENPVVIIDGQPGSGKTMCLKNFVAMYGPQSVLCAAMMNAHIHNLYKQVSEMLMRTDECMYAGRFCTNHNLLDKHRFLCADCIPTLEAQRGTEKARMQRTRAMDKLNVLYKQRQFPEDRVNATDGLFDYPFEECMLERVRVLIVEESSLQYNRMFALLLWSLIRCAPNFSTVVLAGDCNQLVSLHSGRFLHCMSEAFRASTLTMRHCHRFNKSVLFHNAEAIVRRNPEKIVFDNDACTLVETTNARIEFDVNRLILREKLTTRNTQFICRTNAMRHLIAPIINKNCLPEPALYNPLGFCVGQILQSKRTIPPVLTNMLFELIAVAYVVIRDKSEYGVSSRPSTGCLGVNPSPDESVWVKNQLDELVVRSQLAKTGLSLTQQATLAMENPHTGSMSFLVQHSHKDIFHMLRYFLTSNEAMYEWGSHSNQLPCLPLPFNAANSVSAAINKRHKLNMENDVFHVQMVSKSTHGNTVQLNGTVPVLVCRERKFEEDGYDPDAAPEEGLYFLPYVHGEKQFIQDGSAVTNHTMQGSQAPQVVVVEPHDTEFMTAPWLYTASTRCTERIWYLMQKSTLMKACRREESVRFDDTQKLLEWAMSLAPYTIDRRPLAYEACALLELMERARYLVRNKTCVDNYKKHVDSSVDEKAIGLRLKRLLRDVKDSEFNRKKHTLLQEEMGIRCIDDVLLDRRRGTKRKFSCVTADDEHLQEDNAEPATSSEPPHESPLRGDASVVKPEPSDIPTGHAPACKTEPGTSSSSHDELVVVRPKQEPFIIPSYDSVDNPLDTIEYECVLPVSKCWK